jgi:hypothetical protein
MNRDIAFDLGVVFYDGRLTHVCRVVAMQDIEMHCGAFNVSPVLSMSLLEPRIDTNRTASASSAPSARYNNNSEQLRHAVFSASQIKNALLTALAP